MFCDFRRFLLISLMMVTSCAMAGDARLGIVNVPRVSQASIQAETASAQLESAFEARRAELLALGRELEYLKDQLGRGGDGALKSEMAAKEAELRQGEAAWSRDLEQARKAEGRKFQEALREAMRAVARDQGYDVILIEGIGYANASVDLTDAVIERMNRQYQESQSK